MHAFEVCVPASKERERLEPVAEFVPDRPRRLGYAAIIDRELTPQPEAIAEAKRIVAAFERAREDGAHGVEVDGNLVEMPTYIVARRLLARASAFGLA